MKEQRRIIIPCRLAFLNCFSPKKIFGKERYSCVALVDKDDAETVAYVREVIEELKQKALDKWGGRLSGIRSPLHDGDEEKAEISVFRHCYYLNAKSDKAPQVVDQKVMEIKDPSRIYSGCYANISLIFYLYNYAGTKGVGVWLGNIQLVRDGDQIVSQVMASEEFQPLSVQGMLSEFEEVREEVRS